MPISGPLLIEKAKKMQTNLHDRSETLEQKITDGWLHKFKVRHGIMCTILTIHYPDFSLSKMGSDLVCMDNRASTILPDKM